MTPEFHIFLLSTTPIGELRAAIPVGLTIYNLNWFYVYIISVLGNLVPVVLLLLFLEKISNYLSKKSKTFQRFFLWLFGRTRDKYSHRMKKYGQLALVAFVAVPLPLTGAWTASLVAFLFGIPFKKSFASISLGVITAGLIVTFITKTGIAIEKYYGWQVFVGFLLALAFIWLMYYKIQTSRFASCCVRTVGNSFGIKKNSRKNNKYVKPGPLP